MVYLLHHLIQRSAKRTPDAPAVSWKQDTLSYAELDRQVRYAAAGLRRLGIATGERVAVYLPKQFETVVSLFATTAAGGVFVPVNPVLKPEQVAHILRDCDVRVLVTSADRAGLLNDVLAASPCVTDLVLTGLADHGLTDGLQTRWRGWSELSADSVPVVDHRIDADVAAILYTSGSTGPPKGVVLSHRNLIAGAESVASYLGNTAADRLLAVLPFSFDYGLSQLTTAFHVGASVVLMDYLLPRDVVRAIARHQVTGLAAVPPLWNQLAVLPWPEEATGSLRYLTSSGGVMPVETTRQLRRALPTTDIYLMYGLTEAFRSTYLSPGELGSRPESIGKAIPNAEIVVVRPDGSECDDDEPGELVHRGALVALGYWGDPETTAIRFRPAPGQDESLPNPELAVWSGDQVRRDADGFLYFVGRNDEMIKTSGYRVSPGEIEDVVFQIAGVAQAVAFGAPHPQLGNGIVLIAQTSTAGTDEETILGHCRVHLPLFMLPGHVELLTDLPRNPNGKIDRKALAEQFATVFTRSEDPSP